MFLNPKGDALKRLHSVIDANPLWEWEVDGHFCLTGIGNELLRLLGYERRAVIGKSLYAFMAPDEATRVARYFATKPGIPFSSALTRHLSADGASMVLESNAVPVPSQDGILTGYRGIARRGLNPWVPHSEGVNSIVATFNTAPTALCMLGPDGCCLAANVAFAAVCGFLPAAMVGGKISTLIPQAGDWFDRCLKRLDAGRKVSAYEMEHNGQFFQVQVNPIHNPQGKVAGVTTAWTDITHRKREEQKLKEINRCLESDARSDHLTGLPNRRQIDHVLNSEIKRAMRSREALSLLMIDIDFFKSYNDYYGHLHGDACLRKIAMILQGALHRQGDIVGRYGGDEFVAILPATDRNGANNIAKAMLQAAINLGMPHSKSSCGNVTLSIGIATLDITKRIKSASDGCAALFAAADRALYVAKLAGRNTSYNLPMGEIPHA